MQDFSINLTRIYNHTLFDVCYHLSTGRPLEEIQEKVNSLLKNRGILNQNDTEILQTLEKKFSLEDKSITVLKPQSKTITFDSIVNDLDQFVRTSKETLDKLTFLGVEDELLIASVREAIRELGKSADKTDASSYQTLLELGREIEQKVIVISGQEEVLSRLKDSLNNAILLADQKLEINAEKELLATAEVVERAIYVKTLSGMTLTMNFTLPISVFALKEKIFEKLIFQYPKIKEIFIQGNGKILPNEFVIDAKDKSELRAHHS